MGETLRALAYLPRGTRKSYDHAALSHDERRVRRRVIHLAGGDDVLVDFPEPVTLADGSALQLEDGRHVEIVVTNETLYEVRGRDANHLMQLAWHIGNRHAKAEVDPAGRIVILRDHVLRDMLIGLGATVTEISEPFSPMDGAYAHDHGHALLNR